jgi:glycosyltransferase involved in cell wall biosynthesis
MLGKVCKDVNPNCRWVADYRDLWQTKAWWGIRLWLHRQRTIVSRSDMLTTVSEELQDQLGKVSRNEIEVIPNGYDDLADSITSGSNKSAFSSSSDEYLIVYTGRITTGDRNPLPLFRAMSAIKHKYPNQLRRIVVEFYGSYLGNLEALIEKENVQPYVRIMGYKSRPDILRRQSEADALLLLESEFLPGNMTGKVFEYLKANKPILSLGSAENSAIGRLLRYCGTGTCFGNDVDKITEALLELITGKPVAWYKPNSERIAEFSRERLARRMLALLRL